MRYFEVKVFDEEEAEFSPQAVFVVKSKEPRHAITNVLTNKYKGIVTKIEVKEVNVRYEQLPD